MDGRTWRPDQPLPRLAELLALHRGALLRAVWSERDAEAEYHRRWIDAVEHGADPEVEP